MSSGSKQTVLSAAVLAGSLAFTASAARKPAQAGPVHLVVPPVATDLPAPEDPHVLRVCADPNNMPFSNDRMQGFENRIASLVAHDLGRSLRYYWKPQRRGFIRTTLKAYRCDVVIGVPSSFDLARVTRPYYRSSFYFVSRRARGLHVRSLDDPRLRRLRIGIEITGEDYENPPAAQALAKRHILDNVHGYTVYGDYSTEHPSWGVLDALERNEVDLAIAWGPLAGYFARHEHAALEMTPVTPEIDMPFLPFVYDISMAVRREDTGLAASLDAVIARRASEIHRILASYGVPLASSRQGVEG